ncbi:hypothetical protein VNO78_27164 [Psophocarpus tetragonolobus]|uniref:RING-type domain-containing protein n=1 Tax=Psophocarpus tetragonolobus TaxID=3891 RepID=A0AAN9S0V2_PSOTE
MDNNDHEPLLHGKVGTLLIAMASASFVVTMFHLIILCRTHRHVTNQPSQHRPRPAPPPPPPSRNTVHNASALPHLIPAHKYEKKKKTRDVRDGEEDGTCAVCLGDFEEGEELRTLPECEHSFHVACIDTWLLSHWSCPVCRAEATPSPAVGHLPPEFGSGDEVNEHHRSIDIVEMGPIHNGLAASREILR